MSRLVETRLHFTEWKVELAPAFTSVTDDVRPGVATFLVYVCMQPKKADRLSFWADTGPAELF